jgi:uncharacterized protein
MTDDLYRITDDGVVLSLHVVPGAGRTAVVGRHGTALKVKVAAPPERGRANEAVVELVASTLGLPTTAVELVGGASSRSKQVRVTGVDAADVDRLLRPLVADGGDIHRRL